MKKLFILMTAVLFLSMASAAGAVDRTAIFTWEQPCIEGCTIAADGVDRMPVIEWRIYVGDASGVYDSAPLATIVYNGTPTPTYTSDVVLSLSGIGTKYFVVRAYNPDAAPPESGNSNEVNYPYAFAGTSVPVTFTFTIQSP